MFHSPSLFNRSFSVPLLRLTAASLFVAAFSAEAANTTRVSVSSTGVQGNSSSLLSSISADGRFVVFESSSTNFVPKDNNRTSDIFAHDRITGQTTRVSVNSAGKQGNGLSTAPTISADGRFVAFTSGASNLVAGDTNEEFDIFVHDRLTGKTECVSVSEKGGAPKGGGYFMTPTAISADGRFVAFHSQAADLVAEDTNNAVDVFVHDRMTGKTERANVSSAGIQANAGGERNRIAMSADGRFVAYSSYATNLVDGDTNHTMDAFVRDRATNKTERISVNSAGEQGNSGTYEAAGISADGRFVAFTSWASNLVADDTNGTWDGFIHDRSSGLTKRVSVSSSGAQGNDSSFVGSISVDGRFVAFWSDANNLVTDGTEEIGYIFVHDRITGKTEGISVNSSGNLCRAYSPEISADGRFVAFDSWADNLVPDDPNGISDISHIYVRDRLLQKARNADLQIAVTEQPSSVVKGQSELYTLTITNAGSDDAAAVNVTDVISNGTAVSLKPSQGGCSRAAVSVCRLGSLAAGASATVAVTLKGTRNPLGQQISVNAAPVDSTPLNNITTVSTPVMQ